MVTDNQIELGDLIEGLETYDIKPLIYSLSLTCYKTICPYCKIDNPNATELNDCTNRIAMIRQEKSWYPYADKPLNYCPACGKRFDTNCEVRMTSNFIEMNKEYISTLYIDKQGRYRVDKEAI